MRCKMFLLACVAALATALPANATLVFEFWKPVIQDDITTFASTQSGPFSGAAIFQAQYQGGGPITSLNLNAGQEAIITVVLHQTDNLGPDTITSADALIGYGFGFRYLPGVAIHKPPVTSTINTLTSNTSGLNVGGFSGLPNVFTNIPGASVPRDLTLASYFAPSTYYALTSFRISAVGGGVGTFDIFDPSASDDIGNTATPGMDASIYSHAIGGEYHLPVVVVAVPEPTSMALVGLAIAGLGYRARRKLTAK